MSSSNDPAFLNSRSAHAVLPMPKFLAANPSIDQGPPLHHTFSNVGADLGVGFDINTAGLTLSLHKELADVSRTSTPFPKGMNLRLL